MANPNFCPQFGSTQHLAVTTALQTVSLGVINHARQLRIKNLEAVPVAVQWGNAAQAAAATYANSPLIGAGDTEVFTVYPNPDKSAVTLGYVGATGAGNDATGKPLDVCFGFGL